jgi:REP element-mobilizing transposase RayT
MWDIFRALPGRQPKFDNSGNGRGTPPREPLKATREGVPMDRYETLSHTKWECKYHIVFIPKYRRKVLYGQLRRQLGEVFHRLAQQKESRIEEGHLQADHVHMMMSIPPKYSVAQVVGYLKGKSELPPVSWTPDPFRGKRSSRCPNPTNRTHWS